MANKEASVKLTLKAGGFLGGLREVSASVQRMGKQVQQSLRSATRAGLGDAKAAALDLGRTIKGTLAQAATLGGALSVGASAKQAVELVSKYRNIAFAIQAGTGKAVDYRNIQREIEGTANKWSQSNDDVADSFKAIYDDVGNVEFARAAIEEVAKTATASGIPMATLSTIAGQLNEKFGISAKELPDSMAAMISIANKGGVGVEDLGAKIGMLGATAKLAGLTGKDGMQIIVGMLNIADASTGNFKKSLKAVTGLMEQLGDPAQQKEIQKTLGLKVTTKDGAVRGDALQAIMQRTGGKQEILAKVFKGEQLKLMTDFGKIYGDAFGKAGGSAKDKTKAATDALNAALQDAGRSALSAAQLEAEATKRLEDPKAKLQAALNTLAQEFSKPEMIAAFQEMAKAAPPVAKMLAKLASFTLEHPVLAAGALAGGKVGGAGLAGGLSSVAGSAGSSLAATAGPAIAKAAGNPAMWKGAGAVLGAAAAGFMAGKVIADEVVAPQIDKGFKSIDELNAFAHHAQTVAESPRATAEEKSKVLAELQARIKATQEGGNVSTTVMGWLAHAATGGEAKTDAEIRGASVKQGEDAARALQASLTKGGTGVEQSLLRGAAAIERAAGKLDKPGGGNGLPPAPGNAPGFGGP